MRATAFDREAAQQCGVDVDRVNSAVFAIAAALGGVGGFLVGIYYNSIDPGMGYQAGLKGIIAQMIGGMGSVPGAIAGSLLLGIIESYGIASALLSKDLGLPVAASVPAAGIVAALLGTLLISPSFRL